MPVILMAQDYATWLDPQTPTERLLEMLRPLPDGLLMTYPVSSAVNKPVNDTAENVEAIAL